MFKFFKIALGIVLSLFLLVLALQYRINVSAPKSQDNSIGKAFAELGDSIASIVSQTVVPLYTYGAVLGAYHVEYGAFPENNEQFTAYKSKFFENCCSKGINPFMAEGDYDPMENDDCEEVPNSVIGELNVVKKSKNSIHFKISTSTFEDVILVMVKTGDGIYVLADDEYDIENDVLEEIITFTHPTLSKNTVKIQMPPL